MLDDLQNRILQFKEVNDMYLDQNYENMNPDKIEGQQMAFDAVLRLVKQLKKTGKINRGNEFVPDDLEAMVVKNKYQPTLKV